MKCVILPEGGRAAKLGRGNTSVNSGGLGGSFFFLGFEWGTRSAARGKSEKTEESGSVGAQCWEN